MADAGSLWWPPFAQGTAPLKLPDGGTFPPVSEVASAVLQLSADLVLDEVQAYIILARSSRHWVRDRGERWLTLSQRTAVHTLYYSERLQLLQIVQDLLEAGETGGSEDLDTFLQSRAVGLETEACRALLSSLGGEGLPPLTPGAGELAALAARERVLEQRALLSTLILLYYFPRQQATPARFLELGTAIHAHLLLPQLFHSIVARGDVQSTQKLGIVLLTEMLDTERLVSLVGAGEAPAPATYAFAASETLSKINGLVSSWWERAQALHSPLLLVWAAVLQLLQAGAGSEVEGARAQAHAELAGQLGALGTLCALSGLPGQNAAMTEAVNSVQLSAVSCVLCAFALTPLAAPLTATSEIVATLCHLFQDQPSLCEGLWQQARSSDAPLLSYLDGLRALFPAFPSPLYRLLAALASSPVSAAAAVAYFARLPGLATLQALDGDVVSLDPGEGTRVVAGRDLRLDAAPSVHVPEGVPGQVLGTPPGFLELPVTWATAAGRHGAHPDLGLVGWTLACPEATGFLILIERGLAAQGALRDAPAAPAAAAELAAALALVARVVAADAGLALDLLHIAAPAAGKAARGAGWPSGGQAPGGADVLTLAIRVLAGVPLAGRARFGALAEDAATAEDGYDAMLADALDVCAVMVQLAPDRVVRAVTDHLLPERCWSRLARPDGPGRDRACALAAIRLATALLTHLPSSEVTEELVARCVLPLMTLAPQDPFSPASCQAMAARLRLVRLALTVPAWEAAGPRLLRLLGLGGERQRQGAANLVAALGQAGAAWAGATAVVDAEACRREWLRLLPLLAAGEGCAAVLSSGSYGGGGLGGDAAGLREGDGARMPLCDGAGDRAGPTALARLAAHARSAAAGPEDQALALQCLALAARHVALAPALGGGALAALCSVTSRAVTRAAAAARPALFAAGCALWLAALEEAPGARQAGLLGALCLGAGGPDGTCGVREDEKASPDATALDALAATLGAGGELAAEPRAQLMRVAAAACSARGRWPAPWRRLRAVMALPRLALEVLRDPASPPGLLASALVLLAVEGGRGQTETGAPGQGASSEADWRAPVAQLRDDPALLPSILRTVLGPGPGAAPARPPEAGGALEGGTEAAARGLVAALRGICAADAPLAECAAADGSLLHTLLSGPEAAGAEALLREAVPSSTARAAREGLLRRVRLDPALLRRRLGVLGALCPRPLQALEAALRARGARAERGEALEARARPALLDWLAACGGGLAPGTRLAAAQTCFELLRCSASGEAGGGDVEGAAAQARAAGLLVGAGAGEEERAGSAAEGSWTGTDAGDLALACEEALDAVHALLSAAPAPAGGALVVLQRTEPGPEPAAAHAPAASASGVLAVATAAALCLLRRLGAAGCVPGAPPPPARLRRHAGVESASGRALRPLLRRCSLLAAAPRHAEDGEAAALLALLGWVVGRGLAPGAWAAAAAADLDLRALVSTLPRHAPRGAPTLDLVLACAASAPGAGVVLELGGAEALLGLARRLVEGPALGAAPPAVELAGRDLAAGGGGCASRRGRGVDPDTAGAYAGDGRRSAAHGLHCQVLAALAVLGEGGRGRGAAAALQVAVLSHERLLLALEPPEGSAEQPLTLAGLQEARATLFLASALLRQEGHWRAALPGALPDLRAASARFLSWAAQPDPEVVCAALDPSERAAAARPPPHAVDGGWHRALAAATPASAGSGFTWRVAEEVWACVAAALAFQLGSAPQVDEQEAAALGPQWVDADAARELAGGALAAGARLRDAAPGSAEALRTLRHCVRAAASAKALLGLLGRELESEEVARLAGLVELLDRT
ncbi:NUP188 [Auxenochlorella protothecoides x Auxenochlorella symbiontica]